MGLRPYTMREWCVINKSLAVMRSIDMRHIDLTMDEWIALNRLLTTMRNKDMRPSPRSINEVSSRKLYRLFLDRTVREEQGASAQAHYYDTEEEALKRAGELLVSSHTRAVHIYITHAIVTRRDPAVTIQTEFVDD